jgi:hypothetical protein
MQSVPITTKVVSLNSVHGEVHSIQHYVIKFVSDLRQVGGFLWVLRFLHQWNGTSRYSWNIVESGVITITPITPFWFIFPNNTFIWYIPLIAAQVKIYVRVISWNIWKQTTIDTMSSYSKWTCLFIGRYVLLLEIQLLRHDCCDPVNPFNPATLCACPIPGPGFQPVSSTNKTDRHDITEIFLKVALSTITH